MTALDQWMYEWAKGRKGAPRAKATEKGEGLFRNVPEHIAVRQRPHLANLDAQLDRKAELSIFLNTLKLIPATLPYDRWFEIGAAIHDFDPGPDGLLIYKTWSWQSERHRQEHDQAACEKKWLEYAKPKPGKALITKATVYALAAETERAQAIPKAEGVAPTTNNEPSVSNENNGARVALPVELTRSPIQFPDVTAKGAPKETCANARVAIRHLGLACEYDTFHDKMRVEGLPLGEWAGALTDHVTQMLRVVMLERYGLDPGTQAAHDAAVQECLQHTYHPILRYLDGLQWDGQPRLARWLTTYMQADDTEFTRESGKLMLLAAVRRVREPGAKFDQIMVLEGPEGRGKSLALQTMAGDDNFSDHPILTLDDRGQQEEVRGVWLYEISELSGIRKADIDRVKAFASRTVDRARPAYARHRIDQARTCVFFGTTNERRYLQSMTGNRRFWPIATRHIMVEEIARDRDQLWAEADHHIKHGASIGLAERFWKEAADIQEDRRERDPWELVLDLHPTNSYQTPDGKGQEWRIGSLVLLEDWLDLTPDKLSMGHYKRLANVMRKIGWEGPEVLWIDNRAQKGFKKQVLTGA